jgi:hypothetical protein
MHNSYCLPAEVMSYKTRKCTVICVLEENVKCDSVSQCTNGRQATDHVVEERAMSIPLDLGGKRSLQLSLCVI